MKLLISMMILLVAAILFAPLALIWAINTLFPVLAIPYTLETYAAALIVISLFGSIGSASAKARG